MNTEEPILAPPQKLKYHIQLLRCKDWSVQNGVFLLGAFFSDDLLSQSWGFIAASLILSCLCLAYGYSLNEYFDELKDKLSDSPQTAAQLFQLIYIFLGLALLVSWFISTTTFVTVALIGITVWLHSSPPFLLKRQLFWRLFLNSLGFALFFLVGASLNHNLSRGETMMGVFIFGLYLPLELIHVLAHMDSDKTKGFPTVALVYGEKKAIILGIIFLIALTIYAGRLWQLKFVSTAFVAWSVLHLSLLLLALGAVYRQRNNHQTYGKLRLRAKIVCSIYGIGLLGIFVAKL